MKKGKINNFRSPFDDRDLPVNTLSLERIKEIENLVLPKMQASFDKLKQEQPNLFNSNKKK